MDALDRKIQRLVNEELTKSEVTNMIKSNISSELSSRDFKKVVRDISSDVIEDLFKSLWQNNNIWKSRVKNG